MMKKIVSISFFIFVFTSCNHYILNDLPSKKMSYNNLPVPLQTVFMDNLRPYVNELGANVGGVSKSMFVNFDTSRVMKYQSELVKNMFSSAKEYLLIDGIEFEIKWDRNLHHPPYIFYENSIFYLESQNVFDDNEIKEATYVQIDVSEIFKN